MARKRIFISDTHFGNQNFTQRREDLFIDFLDEFVLKDNEIDRFYSLGDSFEIPEEMWPIITANKRLNDKLNAVGEHTEYYVIVGNHDIGLSKIHDFRKHFPHLHIVPAKKKRIILRERVGDETTGKMAVETLTSGKEVELYGKRIHIAHGFEYDHYFTESPRRFHSILRLIHALEAEFGPNIDDWVLDAYKSIREKLGADPELIGNRRELLLAARDIAQYRVWGNSVRRRKPEKQLDYVIVGHTHWQTKRRLYDDVLGEENPLKAQYVNTGCWLETPRYKGSDFTVLGEDGIVKNYKWEKLSA